MRKISGAPVAVFFALLGFALALGVLTTWLCLGWLPPSDFRGILLSLGGFIFVFLCIILIYRLFLRLFPLEEGDKPEGSRAEFVYHVYILFYLLIFYPFMLSNILPVPLLRSLYIALGARIGVGSYGACALHDPPLMEIGIGCVLGQDAIIAAHHMVGSKIVHKRVRIGDRVTVGAGARISAGVQIREGALIGINATVSPLCIIGERAIIQANSFLKPGSRVRAGETWGGVPAKRLGAELDETTREA